MIKSETIGKVADALRLAQGQFKPIIKTAENPFYKSKYAPLDSVIDATMPALHKNGLTVSQMMDGDNLVTVLIHTSGEYIGGLMPLHAKNNDPQGQGSAITYARRYALAAILGVASEDDDDGNQATHKPKTGGNLDV